MIQTFLDRWDLLIIWVAGAAIVGFVIDTVLFRVLSSRSERLHRRIGREIARALHGFPTAIAVIIGIKIGITKTDLDPSALNTANNGLIIASIFIATAFTARLAGRLIRVYTTKDDAILPSSSIFVNLARGLIWVIGGLTLMASLGISIAPLITALGVGGLAVGLALQPTLANLFAGIQVLLSHQIEPGDFVRLESGQEGWVHDVTWRNTTIKMFSNDLIIVPNSKIGQSLLTNFTSLDEQHSVYVTIGVAYDSDLEHVERVTLEVAREVTRDEDGGVTEFEPILRYKEFGSSSIDFTLIMRVHQYSDRFVIRHEFIKDLHKRYAEEGIEIPFPIRTVYMPEADSSA